MIEELKKLLLAGVGGTALTLDKTQEMINRLVSRGKLTVDEGKKLSEELVQKVKGEKNTENTDREELQAMLIEMNVAQRKDIEDLEERINDLAKKIEELSQ
ncbi:phasin family protein [Lacticigenium naphthae]|uniref:phasin family protein n=1 Tax=Lacticigenium naphthae TaxID=515351 RepID=UPI0004062CEE|nr:hypothetical protein [Lacticigenium naphthae]